MRLRKLCNLFRDALRKSGSPHRRSQAQGRGHACGVGAAMGFHHRAVEAEEQDDPTSLQIEVEAVERSLAPVREAESGCCDDAVRHRGSE